MFRASPSAIAIERRDTGTRVDVNDAWVKMFGYTRDEAIGTASTDLGMWVDEAERDRAMAQFESGNVPFYALSQFGRGSDLRGYRVGQFQDKQMFATQAEYRLEIVKRFGVVAFAGVGGVMPSLSDINVNNLLPSVGGGLRFVVAEKNHVAIRLDGAWGRQGGQFYLTVGEAF